MKIDGAAIALVLITASPLYAQDTITVHADNPPVWGTNARIVEELRIGELDGPDEYTLGRVGGLTVRGDGDIFVVDAQVPIVRQYGPTGQHVRDIGREGGGPGEYKQVMGIHVWPDGRLAVYDPGNVRISVYDSNGVFLENYRVESGFFSASVFTTDTLGNYYVRTADVSRLETRNGVPVEQRDMPTVFLKVSPSGTVVDTIALPLSERTWPSFVLATPEGYRWYFPDERTHAWSDRGYLVVGHNRTYALDLLLPDGSVRRIVRRVEPIPLRGIERTQWETWARFFQQRNDGRGPRYGDLPRTKPVYRALTVDADGRIWIDRYAVAVRHDVEPREAGDERPLYEWREPPTFDVIEPDGTFLGTIILPKDTFGHYRRGLHIWGVASGELREPYVVRLRVIPGG